MDKVNWKLAMYAFDYCNQALTLGNKKQTITLKEAAVLKLLCEHKGRILDRKNTLKKIWGESDFFTRRSMDVLFLTCVNT